MPLSRGTELTSFDLNGGVLGSLSFSFEIERRTEIPLRMDMNKRSFLDHHSNKEVDIMVQAKAEDVWKIIVAVINRMSAPA